MPKLIIHTGEADRVIEFSGTPKVDDVLRIAGISTPHPCGGRGSCGKCSIVLSGSIFKSNEMEQRAGHAPFLPGGAAGRRNGYAARDAHIKTATSETTCALDPMEGHTGAAVDIGTTTIALKRYDLATGTCIGQVAALNTHRSPLRLTSWGASMPR